MAYKRSMMQLFNIILPELELRPSEIDENQPKLDPGFSLFSQTPDELNECFASAREDRNKYFMAKANATNIRSTKVKQLPKAAGLKKTAYPKLETIKGHRKVKENIENASDQSCATSQATSYSSIPIEATESDAISTLSSAKMSDNEDNYLIARQSYASVLKGSTPEVSKSKTNKITQKPPEPTEIKEVQTPTKSTASSVENKKKLHGNVEQKTPSVGANQHFLESHIYNLPQFKMCSFCQKFSFEFTDKYTAIENHLKVIQMLTTAIEHATHALRNLSNAVNQTTSCNTVLQSSQRAYETPLTNVYNFILNVPQPATTDDIMRRWHPWFLAHFNNKKSTQFGANNNYPAYAHSANNLSTIWQNRSFAPPSCDAVENFSNFEKSKFTFVQENHNQDSNVTAAESFADLETQALEQNRHSEEMLQSHFDRLERQAEEQYYKGFYRS